MSGILVTGANGFVGSATLAALVRDEYRAYGLVRRTSDLKRLHELSSDIDLTEKLRVGDLSDDESLEAALESCELIIHSAALASDWGSKKKFHDSNAAGVARLIRAGSGTIKRFILISTANVAGYGRRDVREDDPAPAPRFLYSASKLEGEEFAKKLCASEGISLQILRPGGIYGPGDWKWSHAMCRKIETGGWPIIDKGVAVFTPVFIGNLTQAIVRAVERPNALGVYNITDDARISWIDFSETLADRLGVELRARMVPSWFAYGVAVIMEAAYKLVRASTAPGATRYRVVRASRDFDYSCAKAIDALGYVPDSDIEKLIGLTVDWYRQHAT